MNRTVFVALLAVAFLAAAAATAGADGSRWEIDLSGGAAWGAYDSRVSLATEDVYGTTTSNERSSDTDTGTALGAAVRYMVSEEIGVEVLAEKAEIDVSSQSAYSLAWASVLGPQSESMSFGGGGSLDLVPVSLNLVGRTGFGERLSLSISAGATWERITLDEAANLGLVTYVGDSIETFAADAFLSSSDSGWSWNAGASVDYAFSERFSLFLDGRWYGDAGGTIESFRVRPGEYWGLHLGDPVTLDDASAEEASAALAGAATSDEIDTSFTRASLGLRFRF